MKKYTKDETSELLEIPIARMREWVGKYFDSEIPNPGKGYTAYWSELDLLRVAVFQKCMEAELSRKKAAAIVMAINSFDLKELVYILEPWANLKLHINLEALKKKIK